MISEVENLEGKTLEVKAEMKAFGGSTANITPGPDGIAPLSKQNSFKKVEAIESLDLNTREPEVTPSTPEEETIPISVTDPSALEGFKMPEINIPILNETPVVEEEPQAKDIAMPEMPNEILAQEPQGVNEGLFSSSTPSETPVEAAPAEPAVSEPAVPETPAPAMDEPVLVNPLLGDQPTTETPAAEEVKAEVIPEPSETPAEVAPAEPTVSEPKVPATSIFEDVKVENPSNNNYDKEELEKYVGKLVNEYNEKLKVKFDEMVNEASKEIVTKIVDIPVFLTEKVETSEEGKKEEGPAVETPVVEAPIVETPTVEEPKVEEKPELESVPTMDTPIIPNLEPATVSEPAPLETPAPAETSEAPKEVIEELPTLEDALETVPALEAIQAQPTEAPVEAPVAEMPLEEVPAEPTAQDQSVFPPASHDNLIEDASSIIKDMPLPDVDNTQIQGKFL